MHMNAVNEKINICLCSFLPTNLSVPINKQARPKMSNGLPKAAILPIELIVAKDNDINPIAIIREPSNHHSIP